MAVDVARMENPNKQCTYTYICVYITVGWLLEFYILETYMAISGWYQLLTVHNRKEFYSAALLEDEDTSTMT